MFIGIAVVIAANIVPFWMAPMMGFLYGFIGPLIFLGAAFTLPKKKPTPSM